MSSPAVLIERCVALAASATGAERESAIGRARHLMQRHNVKADDLPRAVWQTLKELSVFDIDTASAPTLAAFLNGSSLRRRKSRIRRFSKG